MPTVAVFDMTGKKTGEMELNAAVFRYRAEHDRCTRCSKELSG